ncbi:MAG: transcriptional regulator [Candidatus Thermoplasmatota archaeon]
MGVLEYHLNYMCEKEVVASKMNKYYKRYYPVGIGAKEKVMVSALRQKPLRDIVLFLILNPSSSHKKIMDKLQLGASTLSFYLNELVEKMIVSRRKVGRISEYDVIDKDSVIKVLITYKPSFIDMVVDRFLEVWFEKKG